jgi:hypothetical protein
LVVLLVLFAFAGWAYADTATDMRVGEEVPVPQPPVEEFYCQPPHIYLQVYNACTGFGSEVVDDIPDEFVGREIADIVFHVSEWGGFWTDPAGVYVNVYYSECAPGLDPDLVIYFPWNELITEVIYDDPGNYTSYRCTGYLDPPLPIVADMSLGFQVDNPWGEVTPYCGIVMTDDYVTFGDCETYWDATYWGFPRWTLGSDYFGIARDVAYCLSEAAVECTGGEIIFRTCISDCDETMYKFDFTAGTCIVNDAELCIYDADTGEPVDIELCSVPLDWDCGHNGGPNCAYYETTEHPILPGETYGPFDFVTAGGVHANLRVEWTFTLDGVVVSGPNVTYFFCGASANEPSSWGGIKSLYR